jgi:hypothetical protein
MEIDNSNTSPKNSVLELLAKAPIIKHAKLTARLVWKVKDLRLM